MRRYVLLVVACLCLALPSNAVLKEKNLSQSLKVLHLELKQTYERAQEQMKRYTQMNERQHKQMLAIMQRSNQISLMLYSQPSDYIFDLTYACHQATEQFRLFSENRMPYDQIQSKLGIEIERYAGLIESLKQLPPRQVEKTADDSLAIVDTLLAEQPKRQASPFELDSAAQVDRAACLQYAEELLKTYEQLQEQTSQDSAHYAQIGSKLLELNDYALVRYRNIQQSIFSDSGTDYFSIISNFASYLSRARQEFSEKYTTSSSKRVRSEWRGPVVAGYIIFVLFYLVIAIVLSNLIVRLLMKKVKRLRQPDWQGIRGLVIITAGVLIFALSIMLVRTFLTHNFYIMASDLLVEFALLLTAICVSMIVRLKSEEMHAGFIAYTPIVLMGLIVIIFRIAFIPNNLVNLIFPPIVLLFTIWQWWVTKKTRKTIPTVDITFARISLVVMILSTLLSWMGYTLLTVEVFIWWLFQLTCIQAILCFYNILDRYEARLIRKHLIKPGVTKAQLVQEIRQGQHITITWFFDFVHKAFVPIAATFSVIYSIYLAADVFNLADTCYMAFLAPFLNVPDIIQLSLFNLTVVIAGYFLFRYLDYLFKAVYRYVRLSRLMRKSGRRKLRTNEVNLTLGYNVISIVLFIIYVVAALVLLQIPKSGISVITAGLATGVGFAMKDLLNNFFYGISLMAGRLRVGDWIECDGVQGKVESITYQSTQVLTSDGCVMSFLNSTLFANNFKNLTSNHSYELQKISVGIAYGQDVEPVRQLIIDEVGKLQRKDRYGRNVLDPDHGVVVRVDQFGESSVDLSIICWLLVAEKYAFLAQAKEVIYNTLRANGIEIPFPQRDIHIIEAASQPIQNQNRGIQSDQRGK